MVAKQIYQRGSDGLWRAPGRSPLGPDGLPGFASLVLNEQFAGGAIDSSKWHVYDDAVDGHFGGSTRIQAYKPANVVVGAGSSGATDGTSLKLKSIEVDSGSGTGPSSGSAGTRYSYTAGMLDTKTAGFWGPRYGRYEFRCKTPHGQGLWPAFWLTAKSGGATMAEYDILEYFHSQVPGRNSSTLHGTDNTGTFHSNRYTNNGSTANGGGPVRTPFETPTYTPGWHVWAVEIVPVTDATGNTAASPSLPSSYVRVTVFLDGAQVWRVVDTSANYYTTNGGTEDSFWNIYVQGCQIDGTSVGHPRSPLGYLHWSNVCSISGTPPNACSITGSSGTVQAPVFSDPASTFEIDYVKIWKYTG